MLLRERLVLLVVLLVPVLQIAQVAREFLVVLTASNTINKLLFLPATDFETAARDKECSVDSQLP